MKRFFGLSKNAPKPIDHFPPVFISVPDENSLSPYVDPNSFTQNNYQKENTFQNNNNQPLNEGINFLNHPHQIYLKNSIENYCHFCQKTIENDGYVCEQCNLYLCIECIYKYKESCQQKYCKNNHQLGLMKRTFKCDICGKHQNNISMCCSTCDYDLCLDCYFNNNPSINKNNKLRAKKVNMQPAICFASSPGAMMPMAPGTVPLPYPPSSNNYGQQNNINNMNFQDQYSYKFL